MLERLINRCRAFPGLSLCLKSLSSYLSLQNNNIELFGFNHWLSLCHVFFFNLCL
jgi:hypothetical protein